MGQVFVEELEKIYIKTMNWNGILIISKKVTENVFK
jgi:hypothetical protein